MPGLWQQSNAQRMADTIKLRGIAADTKSRSLDRQQRGWELAGTSVLGAVKSRQGMRFEAREAEKERGFLGDQAGLAAQERKDEATLGRRHTVATASELAGTQAGESEADRAAQWRITLENNAARMKEAQLRYGDESSEKILSLGEKFFSTYDYLNLREMLGDGELDNKIQTFIDAAGLNGEEKLRLDNYIRGMMKNLELTGGGADGGENDPDSFLNTAVRAAPHEELTADRKLEVGDILSALEKATEGWGGGKRAAGITIQQIRDQWEGDAIANTYLEKMAGLIEKWLPPGGTQRDVDRGVEPPPLKTPRLPSSAEQLRKSMELMQGAGLQQQPAIRTQEDLDRFLRNRGQ